ncbi:MAG: Kdo hydroxylase family protein [Gammaproteobacteria bacterium]
MLTSFFTTQWDHVYSPSECEKAQEALEYGRVLYFPELKFGLNQDENQFLSPNFVDPSRKNISYNILKNKISGTNVSDENSLPLQNFMHRFAESAYQLITHLLPAYIPYLTYGRTSFRPVQISERKTSYRKDDKRLHVDAFPATPNQGNRLLRVFSNIHPENEPRVWRLGEPFPEVAKRFLPHIRKPLPGTAKLLSLLRLTKSYRTLYDHLMLQIHNRMKADMAYQNNVQQSKIDFPSGSTWIVFTDQVSHAAMSGQYLMEQTFYLPVSALREQKTAPLNVLEKLMQQTLV